LQYQENKRNALVPGILTRVKQKGAAAGYGYFRRSVLSKALRRLLVCSLLKSERRSEDGVLERAPPESLKFGRFGKDRETVVGVPTHCLSVTQVCCSDTKEIARFAATLDVKGRGPYTPI
jgi:hypothetical protein